jgi:hypothetical protein
MTISAYQVDRVIKAYSKQSKVGIRPDAGSVASRDRYKDVVTSDSKGLSADTYERISYNLLDTILKEKTPLYTQQ